MRLNCACQHPQPKCKRCAHPSVLLAFAFDRAKVSYAAVYEYAHRLEVEAIHDLICTASIASGNTPKLRGGCRTGRHGVHCSSGQTSRARSAGSRARERCGSAGTPAAVNNMAGYGGDSTIAAGAGSPRRGRGRHWCVFRQSQQAWWDAGGSAAPLCRLLGERERESQWIRRPGSRLESGALGSLDVGVSIWSACGGGRVGVGQEEARVLSLV